MKRQAMGSRALLNQTVEKYRVNGGGDAIVDEM
jgi:hypothetical protein